MATARLIAAWASGGQRLTKVIECAFEPPDLLRERLQRWCRLSRNLAECSCKKYEEGNGMCIGHGGWPQCRPIAGEPQSSAAVAFTGCFLQPVELAELIGSNCNRSLYPADSSGRYCSLSRSTSCKFSVTRRCTGASSSAPSSGIGSRTMNRSSGSTS